MNSNLPKDFKNTFLNQNNRQKITIPSVPSELKKNSELSNYYNTSSGVPPYCTTSFTVSETVNSDPNIVKSTLYRLPSTQYILDKINVKFSVIVNPLTHKAFLKTSNSPLYCDQCLSYFSNQCPLMDEGSFRCAICNAINDVKLKSAKKKAPTTEPEQNERIRELLNANAHPTMEYLHRNSVISQRQEESVHQNYFYLPTKIAPIMIFTIELSTASAKLYLKSLSLIQKVIKDENFKFKKFAIFIVENEISVIKFKDGKVKIEQADLRNELPFISQDITIPTEEDTDVLFEYLRTEHIGTASESRLDVVRIFEYLVALGNYFVGIKMVMFVTQTSRMNNEFIRESLVYNAISVNLFSMVRNAELEDLVHFTNGRSFLIPNLDDSLEKFSISPVPSYTNDEMYMQLYNLCVENSVFRAFSQIRTSDAIGKSTAVGNGLVGGPNSIHFSQLDSESTFQFNLYIDEGIRNEAKAFLQMTVVYYKMDACKYTLVCNLALEGTDKYPAIYNNICFDAVFTSMVKNLEVGRQKIDDNLIKVLKCYRVECCKTATSNHLHLPESIKILPVLVNSIAKNPILLKNPLDTKFNHTLGKSTLKTVRFFYPKLFALFDYFTYKTLESVKILNLNYESLSSSEIYVLENGERIYIYFGSEVDPNVRNILTQENDSEEKAVLDSLIDEISCEYSCLLPAVFVMQGKGGIEVEFNSYFVENRLNNCMSYEDYIYFLHHKIAG